MNIKYYTHLFIRGLRKKGKRTNKLTVMVFSERTRFYTVNFINETQFFDDLSPSLPLKLKSAHNRVADRFHGIYGRRQILPFMKYT